MTARILVVDDNPLNQKLLVAKLQLEYYTVATANDGVDALEKIEREKPDLILLDVMMPRMDGFETCRRIRANPDTTHLPVIMITALTDITDRVKGLEVGADDFLSKPINDVALMARVRSLLRFKSIMDEWRIRQSMTDQVMTDAGELASPAEPEKQPHVLILEDNPVDQKYLTEILRSHNIESLIVGTSEQALALVQDGDFDLVFASLNVTDSDALRLTAQIRANEETRAMPVLLMGNEADMARVTKGLDLGSNDYLIRPIDTNELLARTRTQLKLKSAYDKLRKNLEEGLSLALVDPLTGIFNRRYLTGRLSKAVLRAQQSSRAVSVLMLDVDHFKKVNDNYGHDAGDRTLKQIAKLLQHSIRPFDLLARMGGEEFIVVMPEVDSKTAALAGERLRKCIEDAVILTNDKGEKIPVTMSIGCAEVRNTQGEDAESVIIRADQALYMAKNGGRNRVVVSED